MSTHVLMANAVPTRLEKRRLAAALGLKSESQVYAYCEDQEGSGRPNPIDKVDAVLNHALVHHPDAALAIISHFESRAQRILGERGSALPVLDLVATLQPVVAKEGTEAVLALSEALRQGVLSGRCSPDDLLREVQEGERTLKYARTLIEAAIASATDHAA